MDDLVSLWPGPGRGRDDKADHRQGDRRHLGRGHYRSNVFCLAVHQHTYLQYKSRFLSAYRQACRVAPGPADARAASVYFVFSVNIPG